MKFIDTHSHIYLEEFDDDRGEIVEKAIKEGVDKILLPNVDIASIEPLLQLCNQYPEHCYPMMGLHPCSVKEDYLEKLKEIEGYLDKNIVAIGEIGTDLYWEKQFIKQQQDALYIQLDWASKYHLPVVIHTRDSFDEAYQILKQFPNVKGVFHCFSGDEYHLKKALELDYYIGIGGVVTFKNAKDLQAIIKILPMGRILLETDSPYLAPVPHRGRRNESSYIPIIAEQIADIKEISIEEVAKHTSANAKKLFKLA